MRDYIHNKLYQENKGYYSNSNSQPIGRLESPLNFINMRGIGDYTKELNEKYPKSTWLTCPELLRPYFGYAVGNYILTDFLQKKEKNKLKKNIKILEIGFGMGGAIDSILEYFRNFAINNYKHTEYLGFEVTKSLHQCTSSLLERNHSELFTSEKIKLINKSIYDHNFVQEEFNKEEDEWYLLSFNLINSLPHDRIKIKKEFYQIFTKELNEFYSLNNLNDYGVEKDGKDLYKKFFEEFLNKEIISQLILETHVNLGSENLNSSQEFINLKDPLIKEMLFYYLMPDNEKISIFGEQFYQREIIRKKKYESWFIKLARKLTKLANRDNFIWLPSGAVEFFNFINQKIPNHKLILLDFDLLPSKIFNCDYFGENSPAVYSIIENSLNSETHSSIFDNFENKKKPVNVYFPIDFGLIQVMYKKLTGKASSVNKFEYFMMNYSMNEWCETRSGFNPLLDTHHNTSFMLSLD